MAEDKNIAIEVEVKGVEKSIESMKDLKNAIKAAKDEQVKMGEQFGTNSKQFQDASKNVAGLKDKVDDLSDSTNSLKGTGVEQLTQGFGQLKEGVMNLDIDKIKIGLNSMKSGIMQFGTSAMTSLSGVQKAMIATGIGAFLVALGLIIAYWDELKGLVSGVSSEQEKLNKQSQDNLDIEKAKQDALGSQDNILKQQGKSEKEILQMKIKQTDETIKASEIQIQNSIATNEAQVKAGERNKEILEGLLKFVSLPITAILKGIDAIGSAVGKDFGLEDKFFGSISKMVFDPEEVKANGDKSLEEQKKALDKLKNDRAGFQLSVNKIDSDAEKTKIENQKKANEEAKKLIDDLIAYNKLADIENQKIDNADALARANLRVERNQDDIDAKINLLNVQKSIELQNKELTTKEIELIEQKHITNIDNLKKVAQEKQKAIDAKILSDKNKDDIAGAQLKVAQDGEDVNAKIALLAVQKDIELQNANLTANEKLLINQKYENDVTALKKAEGEKQAADEKKSREESFAKAQNAVANLQALSDAFFTFKRLTLKKGSAEELAAAKKQFNINKALAITTATIQGVQGVLAAFSSGAAVPVVGAVLGPAYAVLAGVVAAANIAKIASAKFDEGGGGGGGGAVTSGGATPSVPIPSPPTLNTPNANTNSGTTFDSTGKNTSATTPTINVNATIGVDEINSKQNRVSVLEKQSTF